MERSKETDGTENYWEWCSTWRVCKCRHKYFSSTSSTTILSI